MATATGPDTKLSNMATARQTARRRMLAHAAVVALRPQEWIKNSVVLAPVLFAGQIDGRTIGHALLAFAGFCAISSAGYLVNDIRDVELDRRHAFKRFRPIAAGELPIRLAYAMAVALAILGLGLAFACNAKTAGLLAAYGVLTAGYSYHLKQLVIIDVMAIAGCFLLRVVAGSAAINVQASRWLLLCTGFAALFLGFTKRRQEAMLEAESPRGTRPVLEHYSLPFLDQMVAMVTAGTVISYAIYATTSPIAGSNMLATVPMVVYGLFRYLYLIYHREDPRSTATLITADVGIRWAAIAWVVAAALVVYTH
jgi:4-hydroxybenzoate polyprenyltransferase